jgi:hypothetical protein
MTLAATFASQSTHDLGRDRRRRASMPRRTWGNRHGRHGQRGLSQRPRVRRSTQRCATFVTWVGLRQNYLRTARIAFGRPALTTLSRQTTYSTCASILVSISRPGFRPERVENSPAGGADRIPGALGGGNRGGWPLPFPRNATKFRLGGFFGERDARKRAFAAASGSQQGRKKGLFGRDSIRKRTA